MKSTMTLQVQTDTLLRLNSHLKVRRKFRCRLEDVAFD